MKKVWCIWALFLAITSCFAQQKRNLTEMEQFSGVKLLKSFYYQYITHELNWDQYYKSYKSGIEWRLRSQQMMREELFVPELIAEMNEWEFLSADHVIHAHEAVEYMLKSLDVKPLDKSGWYMVNFAWEEGNVVSIPVKLKHLENGKIKIDYIMPGRVDGRYGDELINRTVNEKEAASGVEILKSFYSRYITNALEGKDEMNEALIAEMVDPFYLEYWEEPKKRVQEVNENMLKSLDVKPLGSPGWYRVSWSCGDGEETILDVKLCKMKERDDLSSYLVSAKEQAFAGEDGKMKIMCDGSIYLTPSKRKAFAKESEALSKRASELRKMSNQDSIAKAVELLDKAIALNHQNLGAYLNKYILLIGKQRYDEALQTLDEAICFHPEKPELYFFEALILEIYLGRMDEAKLCRQRNSDLLRYKKEPSPLPRHIP